MVVVDPMVRVPFASLIVKTSPFFAAIMCTHMFRSRHMRGHTGDGVTKGISSFDKRVQEV